MEWVRDRWPVIAWGLSFLAIAFAIWQVSEVEQRVTRIERVNPADVLRECLRSEECRALLRGPVREAIEERERPARDAPDRTVPSINALLGGGDANQPGPQNPGQRPGGLTPALPDTGIPPVDQTVNEAEGVVDQTTRPLCEQVPSACPFPKP